jgi:Tol biopolymer transport system component
MCRYVAFASSSPSLVEDDLNGVSDVFIWDRVTGTTTRITDGNQRSFSPKISSDGDHIAFTSDASDLAPGDNNSTNDVFLWTRDGSTVTRLTDVGGGSQPSLSGDASTVTFSAQGALHVLDLATDVRTVLFDDFTFTAAGLSFDGRFVTYAGSQQAFLWDRSTGQTRTIGSGGIWRSPDISADGGTVVYEWNRFVGGGRASDVLLWDAASETATLIASSLDFTAYSTISGDGSTIAFSSASTDLVPDDTNGFQDVFVWHRPDPAG